MRSVSLVLLVLGMLCELGAAADEQARSACRELLTLRDAVHTRLAARMRSDAERGPAHDVVLDLVDGLEHHGTRAYSDPSGIERVPLELSLARRGGRWLRPRVAVSGDLAKWLDVIDLHTDALRLDSEGLAGSVELIARLGRPGAPDIGRGNTSHGHLKARTRPVLEWNVSQRKVRAHAQRFTVEAHRLAGRANFQLMLHGALRGSSYNESLDQSQDWARDLRLSQRWVRRDLAIREGHARRFNLAVHEHDASALRWDGDRLAGEVAVIINSDGWVGGGSMSVTIDARLSGGHIVDGRYVVHGDLGESEGRVSGWIGHALAGSYQASDNGRQWRQRALGSLIPVAVEPVGLDPIVVDRGIDDAQLLRCGRLVYRDIAALVTALREYPRAWHAARDRQVRSPAPQTGAVTPVLEALASQAANAVRVLAGAPHSGNCGPDDGDFGPHFGSGPLPVDEAGVQRVVCEPDAAGQRWHQVRGWRVLGPFVTHDVAPPEAIGLPAIALAVDACYPQDWRSDGRQHLAGRSASWVAAPEDADAVRLPRAVWDGLWVRSKRLSTYGDHMTETRDADERRRIVEEEDRAYHWYARSTLRCDEAQTVQLAVRAKGDAQLWIAGRLVWRSGVEYDNRSWAIVPVHLEAGVNPVVVRSAEEITYFPGWGKGWDPDSAAKARSWVRVQVCTRGAPRTPAEVAAALAAEQEARAQLLAPDVRGRCGDGTARFPDADPPMAWDLKAGVNVLWRRELPASDADPVLWGESVYINGAPDTLSCLNKMDGSVRWQRRPSIRPQAGEGDTAAATPLLDPESIWVHYGTGVVVAYRHDGTRRWQTPTGVGWSGRRGGTPVLAGRDEQGRRRLLVVLPEQRARKGEGAMHAILALDADCGAVLWRRGGLAGPAVGLAHLPLVAPDGTHRDTIVDADGALLDAGDGTVILSGIDSAQWGREDAWRLPPRLIGARVYLGHAQTCLRIWLQADGRVGRRVLYHHYRGGGSNPVCDEDGLAYCLRVTDEHSAHGPVPWDMLQVVDLESGFTVAKHKPALRHCTNPNSASLVGEGLLYLADATGGGIGATESIPRMAMMLAGEVPRPLLDLPFLRTRAHPVFEAERLYIQGEGAAWCLAVTDEEGQRFEDAALAKRLIGRRLRKPRLQEVVEVPAIPEYRLPDGLEPTLMGRKTAPRHWLFAGPFPSPPSDIDPLTPIDDINAIGAGTSITWGGRTHEFGPLPEGVLTRVALSQEMYGGRRCFRPIYGLRFFLAVDGKPQTWAYYAAALDAVTTQAYRVDLPCDGVRVWISGVEVAHGAIVRLQSGAHPVLLHIDTPRPPPFDRERLFDRLRVNLTLIETEDPREQYRAWLREVRAYRPWLERLRDYLPGDHFAGYASAYLELADEAARAQQP